MWARLRRRSLGPRRPLMYADQWPVVVGTLVIVVLGVALAVLVLRG
jgi:hypothetical protein